ncbi:MULTISPECIES: GNAT family N-acetyltransferase [Caproicibacterium]|uniref:GNAT family N-acetyltransferase n=1 Tax=Caproicibacterium argilliputei TaxID=3030016 RepID=A0AA97D8A2_9FIRM|nr:GNAT family N-acetyltransferase [Caproicibacterium argilliputei]WOC32164.1 GNAT family N-acetyltransferase [Caproicibacterium argilliputei]
MLTLKKVDAQNIHEILALSVKEEQKPFVAENTESILEAYTTITAGKVALPFGIYEEEQPVGFVMFGYDGTGEEGEPAALAGNYAIWRFMIDRHWQGRGLGRKALEAALAFVRSKPCGEADYCLLSYEPENTVAKALYHSFGFREIGEMDGDEIVAALRL